MNNKFLLFIFILFLNCSKYIEKTINFKIAKEIERESHFEGLYFPQYMGGNDSFLIISGIQSPSLMINIERDEVIETLAIDGEGPGEKKNWGDAHFYGNKLLCAYHSKLMVYEKEKNGYKLNKELALPFNGWYFRILNDTLLVFMVIDRYENLFVLFNWDNGKVLLEFGDALVYPQRRWRQKLLPDFPYYFCVYDSFLIVYDYFVNKFIVYDIFSKKKMIISCRSIKYWKTPKVKFDKKLHRFVTQCPKVKIATNGKYLFIMFEKAWLYNWSIYNNKKIKNMSQKEKADLYSSLFYYFIDVYLLENYKYVGSIYPFNSSILFNEDKNILYEPELLIVNKDKIIIFLTDNCKFKVKLLHIKIDL